MFNLSDVFVLGRHLILVRCLVFVASHTDNYFSCDDTAIEVLADKFTALHDQEHDLLVHI